MKKINSFIFLFFVLIAYQSQAQNWLIDPYIHYRFEGNMTDLKGNSTLTLIPGPPGDGDYREITTSFYDSDEFGNYWRWTSAKRRGGGFTILADKDLGTEYTIYLKFAYDDVGEVTSGWKKIIDYKNKNSDTGFYFYNRGKVQFYSGALGSKQTKNNETIVLICSRSTDNTFKAYVVNETDYVPTLDYTHTTSGANSVFETVNGNSIMGFFFDDSKTASEATSGGKVYELIVWDKELTKEELETIVEKGKIVVHYKDTNGNELFSTDIFHGNDGEAYTIKPKYSRSCYVTNPPNNTTGVYERGKTIEINYIYQCSSKSNPNLISEP